MLSGKKILLGITGSIAAYKAILLVRLIKKAGAKVKVILTPAARNFVSPLVLSTLSQNEVLCDFFDEDKWANHVMLGRWADIMVVAPASCNTLAKMATGQCDNLLLATYLSATCPVILTPAMDEDMWHHPSTRENTDRLVSHGNTVLGVGSGDLASGLVGEGRMAEPEAIILFLQERFFRGAALQGRKVMITAGPTYEAIDPVRFIGNHSSGKMGFALAEACYLNGADVHLITGPTAQKTPYQGIKITRVTSAGEMHDACLEYYPACDIAIMSAAVADYTPASVAKEKIKKTENALEIKLCKTKDILRSLGETKKPGQFLVGFALETSNEREYALGKLKSKNADMIVLNSLNDDQAAFGFDTNKVTVFDRDGNEYPLELSSKKVIAEEIVNLVLKKINV